MSLPQRHHEDAVKEGIKACTGSLRTEQGDWSHLMPFMSELLSPVELREKLAKEHDFQKTRHGNVRMLPCYCLWPSC